MSNMLEIYKNNSKTLLVNVTDSDGEIVNCTGYIPYFSVKEKMSDTGFTFSTTGTTGSTSGSTLTFNLTPTMTDIEEGDYFYDVTIVKSSENKQMTIKLDKLRILSTVKFGS